MGGCIFRNGQGTVGKCLALCKALDIRELSKRVNCAKAGGPVVTVYVSYDILESS